MLNFFVSLEKGEFWRIFGRRSDVLRIAETRHERACQYPLHHHDAHEFLFILSGKGKLRVGSVLHPLAEHDLVFLKRGERHQILDSPEALIHRYSLYFRENAVGRDQAATGFLEGLKRLSPQEVRLPARENPLLANHLLLFRELFFEFSQKPLGFPLLQKAKLTELMIFYARAEKARLSGDPAAGPQIEKKILLLLEDLRVNYFRPQSPRAAAARIPLGDRQFSRLFKKVSGLSFVKYLNRLRIQAAQRLLMEKGHIAAAAFESGFENLPYFYRVFRTETGRTPGDFIRPKPLKPASRGMA